MMHFQRHHLAALALVATAALNPSRALAQPADPNAPIVADEANRLFREGREDFNAGRIKDALRKYRTAWKLRPSPDVAANMGQAELQLGMTDIAAMHLAYALANLLPSTSRDQRVALEESLSEAKTKVAAIRLDLEPHEVAITINDEPLDPELQKTGVFVLPGEHVIVASAEGYASAEKKISVAPGERLDVALHLAPLEEPQEDVVSDAPARGRTAVLMTEGVLAVAGVTVGTVFSLRAAKKNRDADDLRAEAAEETGSGACPEEASAGACGELWDTLSEQGRSRDIATAGFIAGGVFTTALVVTAVVWPKRRKTTQRAVSFGVMGTPTNPRITVGGSF